MIVVPRPFFLLLSQSRVCIAVALHGAESSTLSHITLSCIRHAPCTVIGQESFYPGVLYNTTARWDEVSQKYTVVCVEA